MVRTAVDEAQSESVAASWRVDGGEGSRVRTAVAGGLRSSRVGANGGRRRSAGRSGGPAVVSAGRQSDAARSAVWVRSGESTPVATTGDGGVCRRITSPHHVCWCAGRRRPLVGQHGAWSTGGRHFLCFSLRRGRGEAVGGRGLGPGGARRISARRGRQRHRPCGQRRDTRHWTRGTEIQLTLQASTVDAPLSS